jgi:hypothetical protein
MSLEETGKDDIACTVHDVPLSLDPGLVKILAMVGALTIDYRERMIFGGSFKIQVKDNQSGCC